MKVNVSHDGERNDGTNKELNPFTSSTSNVGSSEPTTTRSFTTSSLILDYLEEALVFLEPLLLVRLLLRSEQRHERTEI